MTNAPSITDQYRSAVRTGLIVNAVIGIVLGIIALVWPGPTLLVVAITFGVALLFLGVYRLVSAFAATGVSGWTRVLFAIFGTIIFVAGFVALVHPGSSLTLLALMIGIGWIFDGVYDLVTDRSGWYHAPRWLIILSGIVSILAGVVVIALPGLAIGTFLIFGAILLIVVSVVSLFTLPSVSRR
ncbi:HdeD family acid-resistance protein [Williamsia sp. CHRR-6]|uniref:HdeD family acid-resistance protein n=1 Tax=Williamsia sp. CHRR-6 TaxID=2835871 RepID=UPI001BDA52EF|nr:DUF308 domain-containing protein [Williamsia sp. CHRR-6]MBT0567431.1 DUF308 domain-containing protein [Williamsia sp. CHRR-6]